MNIYDVDTEWILRLIDDYIQEHFIIISNPDFETILMDDLKQICGIVDDDEDMSDEDSILNEHHIMDDPLYECLYYYYIHFMPRRSFDNTFIYQHPNISEVTRHLDILRGKPQPSQRTPEWYEYRNKVITASSLYKIFGSEALRNELIYEKCSTPPRMDNGDVSISTVSVNTTSALHWGIKYEPVSILIYEDVYSTRIESLGCITHEEYDFIGASPDGVNANPDSPLYGRLIEIKNVKSREIDGTICEQYWVQMQIQMEVCNINDCDFLETKFVEYDSYNDYLTDTVVDSDNIEYEYNGCLDLFYKGLIIYFHKDTEGPTYVYKPLCIKTLEEEIVWETDVINKYQSEGYHWITNIYWKLVVFNCQLVLRNRFWFSKVFPAISDFWEIIKYDRINGSDHRKPSKRTKKMEQLL